MTETAKRRDYTTVSIPFALMDKIDTVIDSKNHGYASRSDFIYDALRSRLRELGIME